MRFKIDWAGLIAGSKCTVFALFYFVFEDNVQVQAPGRLIFRGAISRSRKVFCVTSLRGLYLERLRHGGGGGRGRIFGILRYLFNRNINFYFRIGYVTCFNE